ncbi:hypothetical protein EA462_02640 [Natrarchaeobius halalkaliphilus]|uniref:DUF7311 domain-containing protein n=1 Tax=Natrarchaeobius halalkaliphilus TaxID=1679091 RepID=A0A3N6M9X3_9EURY|nr:hypothetical protein [Natrarchaeobius halalkaliphilus]RQG93120.1 hypothetical protein EA462_02640 [Natrarchaeobius halalkaliphilus]
MIRYVLAVLLTVALVALSVPAIEHGATVQSDRQVDGDVGAIERAAVSLIEHEELPPDGQPPPQRFVTVSLPDDSMTTTPVARFEIERTSDHTSVVTVSLEDSSPRTIGIDAPIVYATAAENRSLELTGTGNEVSLLFYLDTDPAGERVVVATRS